MPRRRWPKELSEYRHRRGPDLRGRRLDDLLGDHRRHSHALLSAGESERSRLRHRLDVGTSPDRVLYFFVGGDRAKGELDSLKDWLASNNAAVMTVLLVIFGVNLIAQGIPPLTG